MPAARLNTRLFCLPFLLQTILTQRHISSECVDAVSRMPKVSRIAMVPNRVCDWRRVAMVQAKCKADVKL